MEGSEGDSLFVGWGAVGERRGIAEKRGWGRRWKRLCECECVSSEDLLVGG